MMTTALVGALIVIAKAHCARSRWPRASRVAVRGLVLRRGHSPGGGWHSLDSVSGLKPGADTDGSGDRLCRPCLDSDRSSRRTGLARLAVPARGQRSAAATEV